MSDIEEDEFLVEEALKNERICRDLTADTLQSFSSRDLSVEAVRILVSNKPRLRLTGVEYAEVNTVCGSILRRPRT